MAKIGEINYLRKLNRAEAGHVLGKPFSDAQCGRLLAEIGAVMSLLPPAPGRLLDLGCGSGWTSAMFAQRGYDVVGVDICPDMIEHACIQKERLHLSNLEFHAIDVEELCFDEEFNCAVFFDSLHHSVDEERAMRKAFEALLIGGICVTSEPGVGHSGAAESLEHCHRFGVTEKDMPPTRIIELARKAGFRKFQVVPHAFQIHENVYGDNGNKIRETPCPEWHASNSLGSQAKLWLRNALRIWPYGREHSFLLNMGRMPILRALFGLFHGQMDNGMVVLQK